MQFDTVQYLNRVALATLKPLVVKTALEMPARPLDVMQQSLQSWA